MTLMKYLFLLLFIALVFTSCKKEVEAPEQPIDCPVGTYYGITTSHSKDTRTVINGYYPDYILDTTITVSISDTSFVSSNNPLTFKDGKYLINGCTSHPAGYESSPCTIEISGNNCDFENKSFSSFQKSNASKYTSGSTSTYTKKGDSLIIIATSYYDSYPCPFDKSYSSTTTTFRGKLN